MFLRPVFVAVARLPPPPQKKNELWTKGVASKRKVIKHLGKIANMASKMPIASSIIFNH